MVSIFDRLRCLGHCPVLPYHHRPLQLWRCETTAGRVTTAQTTAGRVTTAQTTAGRVTTAQTTAGWVTTAQTAAGWVTTAQTTADNPVDDGQPPTPPTPDTTTDDPASHQHHRRPRLATSATDAYDNWRPRLASNTTDVVRQLTTPASHQHHWRPQLATTEQHRRRRPAVSIPEARRQWLWESDSDDELCVLTPQNPARAAVAVPVVTPVVQRPPRDVWQRRTFFNSNPTAKLPGAVP